MNETIEKLQALVERDQDHDCAGFGKHHICVRVVAVAELPGDTGWSDLATPEQLKEWLYSLGSDELGSLVAS